MPYLGDFLGALNREVELSRVHADLEAVRIAEMYARDPLLKHFPVPRVRTPTITIRIPVAVENLGDPPAGLVGGHLDLRQVRASFVRALDDELVDLGRRLERSERAQIDDAVNRRAEELTSTHNLLGRRAVAMELATTAMFAVPAATLKERLDIEPEQFRARLAGRLNESLAAAEAELPRLQVLVNVGQLKDTDRVVELNVTLSEDAVEWAVVNELGESRSFLVPE